MYFRLVDDDKEWQVELAIDEVTRDALMLQTLRSSEPAFRDRFLAQLAALLPQLLSGALDTELRPPTEKQLRFAVAIARELGISIPGDAFRYRDAMGEFLTRHADLFRQRRAAQTRGAAVSKESELP
jgi:hypothetical protein